MKKKSIKAEEEEYFGFLPGEKRGQAAKEQEKKPLHSLIGEKKKNSDSDGKRERGKKRRGAENRREEKKIVPGMRGKRAGFSLSRSQGKKSGRS